MAVKIDQIIRSRRKTVAIEIDGDGRVVVRAPQRLTRAKLQEIVERKSDWIAQKKYEIEERRRYTGGIFLADDFLLLLGKKYRIKRTERMQRIEMREGWVEIPACWQYDLELKIKAWYKEQADQIIKARVEEHVRRTGLKPASIKITEARTRWGSCSNKKNLNFSWRLVLAPLSVIDYVVVHELVHLEHMNHSLNFWQRVEEIISDYREQKQWLKENGIIISSFLTKT